MRSKIFQKGDSNHTLDNLGNTERTYNMLSEGMNTLVWKAECHTLEKKNVSRV